MHHFYSTGCAGYNQYVILPEWSGLQWHSWHLSWLLGVSIGQYMNGLKPAASEEPQNTIWHHVLVRWTAKAMSICLGAPCQKVRPSTVRVNMTAEHLNRSLEGTPVANQHEQLANLRLFLQNNVNAFLLKVVFVGGGGRRRE